MPKPLSIERCQRLLRILGWSWGPCGPDDDRGIGYRIRCSRDDDGFSARGESMQATWNESLRIAGRVQRGQPLPMDIY